MGRTLPTISQVFLQELSTLSSFRRALRRRDQVALDDLLAACRQHLAAVAYAADALPMEMFLLSMLLEEHKAIVLIRDALEKMQHEINEAHSGKLDEVKSDEPDPWLDTRHL